MMPADGKHGAKRVDYAGQHRMITLLGAAAVSAAIGDPSFTPLATGDPPALEFSAGHVGIFDDLQEPGIASAEYRFGRNAGSHLAPAAGVALAENGAWFIYADLHYEIPVSDHWLLVPSIGVGRFGGSEELDLGHLVEFRSGLQVAYRLESGYRIGLVLHHFSNGGISERNPGIEELALTVTIPLAD